MPRRWWVCLSVVIAVIPRAVKADTLRGVVNDERGKPVAGARIDIATAAPKVGRGVFCPSCYADCRKWTRTNEQGEFVIEKLDPKLKFRVLSTAPGKQTKMTKLIDPAKETADFVLPDFPQDTPPSQILEGKIVSAEGTPIAGALVEPYGAKTPEKRWWGPVAAQSAVSDDHGRFKLLITAPDYSGIDVIVSADGYAGTRRALLKPGEEIHEIVVPAGTSVTGQLVSEGRPQPGVRVAVVQTERGVENHFIKSVLAITDQEGRFRFSWLPASQQYVIYSPVGEADPQEKRAAARIVATKKFNCRADNESRDLGALELAASYSVAGRIEMSDGSAPPAGLKLTLGRDPAWDLIEVAIDPQGNFEMGGLPPETYEFVVSGKGIRLDPSRLKFQLVRPNSFGVRLTESRTGILIPLRQDVDPAAASATTKKSSHEEASRPAETDEFVEIAPSKAGSAGTASTPGETRPSVEFTEEPVPADGPKLRVRGTVITKKGERIAGATVLVRGNIAGQFYSMGVLHNRDILARTKSDANGRFVFGSIPIPLRMSDAISSLMADRCGAKVLAYAEGYGMASVDIESIDANDPIRVVLEPEADVRGVIRDASGKGIPGARIELYGISPLSGALSHVMNGPGDINLSLSQLDPVTRTDDQGRFVLRNLPRNSRAMVGVTAERCARQTLMIETTVPSDGKPKRDHEMLFKTQIAVQQSPADLTLDPQSMITVQVVDHDGTPVKEGVVQCITAEGRYFTQAPSEQTGSANFMVSGPGQTRVQYAADPLHPRSGVMVTVEDLEQFRDKPLELRLPETRWVTGRVTNAESGAPVVGAIVWVAPADMSDKRASGFSTAVSRDNGEFRIPAALGENRIWVGQQLYGFDIPLRNALPVDGVVVKVGKEGEPSPVELKLSSGLIVEGTVRDEQGKSVAGAAIRAEQSNIGYRVASARSNAEGKFRIAGLSPSESALLTTIAGAAADRKTIEGGEKGDQEFRRENVDLVLKPGVRMTGRVMKNGKPQSGVKIELSRSLPGKPIRTGLFTSTTTDAEGRFVVGGLDPGDHYSFKIVTRDGAAAPDWKHQSPYAQTIPENPTPLIELPDANLIGSNQSLGGTVVDPDGQPVAGITVSASLRQGAPLGRRDNLPPPWTETDGGGRFQLSHLPDDEIELMAYKRNPAGGQIHYPVRMTPERNQADIRIIVDPRLLDGIESID